jgi:hypothetical protein
VFTGELVQLSHHVAMQSIPVTLQHLKGHHIDLQALGAGLP